MSKAKFEFIRTHYGSYPAIVTINRTEFTWDELTSLLKYMGYREIKTGKASGSRRRFVHDSTPTITLHKPHPQNILKRYTVDQVLDILKQEEMI